MASVHRDPSRGGEIHLALLTRGLGHHAGLLCGCADADLVRQPRLHHEAPSWSAFLRSTAVSFCGRHCRGSDRDRHLRSLVRALGAQVYRPQPWYHPPTADRDWNVPFGYLHGMCGSRRDHSSPHCT